MRDPVSPWSDRPEVEVSSLFIDLPSGDRLHLKRFCGDREGAPVFMLHGAIENGRIFWSPSGKGLAPFIARAGFDVFVADLRGRGESTPPIGSASRFGQREAITEDIPAFVARIVELRGPLPQHWIAHSWGGVLLASTLARFPGYLPLVRSMVFFGSKRTVRAFNWEILLKVRLVWELISPLAASGIGFLPGKRLSIGSDSETVRSLRHSVEWVRKTAWVDPDDGFDYGAALRQESLPPTWYIAARNDHALGNPADVRRFMESMGRQRYLFTVLSLSNGNRRDYDHISMLTDSAAQDDHFPLVLAWLRGGYEGIVLEEEGHSDGR